MTYEDDKKTCQDFADKHGLLFTEEGECGFGRECVGLLEKEREHYLDHNPTDHDLNPIPGTECPDAYAPEGVNSYHKHDCFAVLGRGEEAVAGLAKWIRNLESKGTVRLVEFKTGATGIQAMISGTRGKCLVIDK